MNLPRVQPGSPPALSGPLNAHADHQVERELARRLLLAEASAVAGVAELLSDAFHHAVGLIVACADAGGTVLVTGLGKSGIIGQKIAATLSSVGITSHFVHPAEAVHGDLGRFRAADMCLAISASGETDEVVNLGSILRQDGVPLVSITKGPKSVSGPEAEASSLERLASVRLSIGQCDDEELTPAPTSSTTATLALGDALALCAARRRNFTDDDFAKRHPGGSLGGLLRPVYEVLRFTVAGSLTPVPDDTLLGEALKSSETRVRRPGAMLLIDRHTGKLSGLFTDGDLRRVIERDRSALDRPVREVMTRNPGTLHKDDKVRDAVRMVREFRRDEIPVVDDQGKPFGLLDVQDLVAMKLIRSD